MADGVLTDLLDSNASFQTATDNITLLVNATEASDWLFLPITWTWWVVIQLMVSILGMIGNSLVLLVLFQRRASGNPTDILIGGLAAADVLTSIFMIPQPKLAGVPNTPLGQAACKFIYSAIFLWITISASVFTLTSIAIERYIAVVHPVKFKQWVTKRKVRAWFIAIWFLAVAINSRTFGTTKVDSEKLKCIVMYPTHAAQICLGLLVFLVKFIIPTVIMLLSYSLIARSLRLRSKRFKTPPGQVGGGKRAGPADSLVAARIKVIKLMFVVILTFIFCWTADSIGLLAYNMRWLDSTYLYSPHYHVFAIVAFFNSCVNPLIYAVQYPEFRSAVKDLLSCSQGIRESLFGKDSDQTQDQLKNTEKFEIDIR